MTESQPGRRRNVRLTEEELKELNRQRTARSARGQAECLSEEILFQLVAKKLTRPERERAISHLRACSDCAREYRIARLFKPWAEAVAGRATTSAGVGATATSVGFGSGPLTRPTWSERLGAMRPPAGVPYLLAASTVIVLVLLIGIVVLQNEHRKAVAHFIELLRERDQAVASTSKSLGEARRQLEATARSEQSRSTESSKRIEVEVAELRRRMTEISRPQLNTPIVDLDPGGVTRGEAIETATTVDVPAGTNFFNLILHVAGQRSHSNYALELVDHRNQVVWHGERLEIGPDSSFTISFSRLALPAGKYRIKLYGLRDGQKELIEVYSILVRYR